MYQPICADICTNRLSNRLTNPYSYDIMTIEKGTAISGYLPCLVFKKHRYFGRVGRCFFLPMDIRNYVLFLLEDVVTQSNNADYHSCE